MNQVGVVIFFILIFSPFSCQFLGIDSVEYVLRSRDRFTINQAPAGVPAHDTPQGMGIPAGVLIGVKYAMYLR